MQIDNLSMRLGDFYFWKRILHEVREDGLDPIVGSALGEFDHTQHVGLEETGGRVSACLR